MSMLVTEQLARFALDAYSSPARDRQRERVALCVLDTVASAVGGVRTANAERTRRAMQALFGNGRGRAPVWFTGKSALRPAAIVSNCAAASALDIDDGHRGASGHAGAAVIPSVLTYAAHGGPWTGDAIINAILVGYECALRVAGSRRPTPDMSFASGRWCAYGVAAALGAMAGLDRQTLANAFAIAGAESPCSLPQGASANMGTVKGSSPWSALVALSAIERARCGLTGPLDILDLEDSYDGDALLNRLGDEWRIDETYMKPYASCRYTHPAIDAILALRTPEKRPAAPDAVVVDMFPEAARIPNERRPTTLEEAQFSIPFCVALAWLRGASAFRPMTPEHLADEEVLSLSEQVELVFSERFAGWFPDRTPANVSVEFGGNRFAHTVEHPIGDTRNPMSSADVVQKLRDLSRDLLCERAVVNILAGVETLADCPDSLLEAIR